MANDELLQKLIQIYKVEAEEYIKDLSDNILNLEKNKSEEDKKNIIERVLRIAHSLKGSSRSVNMFQVVNICQIIENVFVALKKDSIILSEELFDLLSQSISITENLLSGDKTKSVPISGLIRNLNNYLMNPDNEKKDNKIDENDLNLPVIEDIVQKQVKGEILTKEIDESENESDIVSEDIINNDLKTVRIDISKLDSLLLQAEEMIAVKLNSEQNVKDFTELLDLFEELEENSENIYSEVNPVLQESQPKFINSNELLEQFNFSVSYTKIIKSKIRELLDRVRLQDSFTKTIVDSLLEDAKKTLMMPFSSILETLPRMIRDIARQQEKKVEFITTGTSIDVDKRILEEIKDALIHLIRNSIDHGIEPTDIRIKQGKKAQACIKISVKQTNDNKVQIKITDDGAGIDLKKIKEIANKSGVNTDELTEKELISFIFKSGFSTSKIVTDISGRGLGVSIVADKVEKLGGSVSVDSAMGLGTTFKILIPLTMSTFRGLIVIVSEKYFVVPINNVDLVLTIKKENIRTVNDKDTILFNENIVPILRLSDVLQIPQKDNGINKSNQAVILNSSGKKVAFYVDEVLYDQEIMIKNLGKQLSRVPNIAGVTIIGSGKIIPLLNISDLIKTVSTKNISNTSFIGEAEKRIVSILVAEDSITSRTLLKNILETAGYKVKTTVDGLDALNALRHDKYDLVISDVEMPRMNGFELTEKIRADKVMSDLPVILVTSLSERHHQEKGIDVGANAYIVKSSFDHNNLLNIIPRLL